MANNGNEFLPNYVEYLVPLQETKYVLPKKLALIAAALALVVLVFVLAFGPFQFLAGFVPIALILVSFGIWYLWRFVSLEYEYTILHGEITFDAVYGRRQRKTVYTAKISAMEVIAPVNGKAPEIQADTERFYACKMKNPNTWYAVVREENGNKTLLYFETYEKTEKVLRFFNAKAFYTK